MERKKEEKTEDAKYIRIICEQLKCSAEEAVTIALKSKAHELTCPAHRCQQQEMSRH
jgi:hypothetical protein